MMSPPDPSLRTNATNNSDVDISVGKEFVEQYDAETTLAVNKVDKTVDNNSGRYVVMTMPMSIPRTL
jgi:hypothetical protein